MTIIDFSDRELTIEEIADRFGELRDEKHRIEGEMKALQKILIEQASFKDGAKTGHVFGHDYTVKVQIRSKQVWDQKKLKAAVDIIGETNFFKLFDWEYFPKKDKKSPDYMDMDTFIKMDQNGRILDEARSVKPEAPYVSADLRQKT
jgi:hypothetical protein